ncbi:hypothetical protein FRB95_000513 [Tulasnella sp. JGI-2019a]|nr:hypothetical protein FRB93_003255 [Tulasnella sp. JGI-2019a]KAG9033171.1 hypothetical protein FRB95_000513 [Tulasnella sp. JGI-2019a]
MSAASSTVASSSQQPQIAIDSLDDISAALTTARQALKGTHTEVLDNMADRVLKLIAAIKRAKVTTADSQPLYTVMLRLYKDLFRPISSAGNGLEIRFASDMKELIHTLCSCITTAVDGTSLIKPKLFSRRPPPKQDLAAAAAAISSALDQFGRNDSMTANIVKDDKAHFVLLQNRPSEPIPLEDINQPTADLGNRERVTKDILEQCPRFRILVLGKTGTGKSSLINRTFNVNIASVSHFKAGESDIDLEITSPENERFILHDSKGFEPGELKNLGVVKDFIRRRNMMPALQDKIHAVWLCIQIPFAQGRLLEVGDEQFLTAEFGLPVIVVFTKYDILSSTKEKEVLDNPAFDALSDDEVDQKVEEVITGEFEKLCVEPLKKETHGRDLPYARVSIYDTRSLESLVNITSEHARKRVGEAVWLTWAVAQRASVQLNVEASIAIGRKSGRSGRLGK